MVQRASAQSSIKTVCFTERMWSLETAETSKQNNSQQAWTQTKKNSFKKAWSRIIYHLLGGDMKFTLFKEAFKKSQNKQQKIIQASLKPLQHMRIV